MAFLLLTQGAWGEEQLIQVPGDSWAVRINARKLESRKPNGNGVYLGIANRLQVTLHVDAPRCGGGSSNEVIYECFASSLKKNPIVKWETERANTRTNGGVLVMYMSSTEVDGKTGSAFNVNVLLSNKDKWVNMHASIASPTREDIATLFSIAESMTIGSTTSESDGGVKK